MGISSDFATAGSIFWNAVTGHSVSVATTPVELSSNLHRFDVASCMINAPVLGQQLLINNTTIPILSQAVTTGLINGVGGPIAGIGGALVSFSAENIINNAVSGMLHLVADNNDVQTKKNHIKVANVVSNNVSNVISLYDNPALSTQEKITKLQEYKNILDNEIVRYHHNPAIEDGLVLGVSAVQGKIQALQANHAQSTLSFSSAPSPLFEQNLAVSLINHLFTKISPQQAPLFGGDANGLKSLLGKVSLNTYVLSAQQKQVLVAIFDQVANEQIAAGRQLDGNNIGAKILDFITSSSAKKVHQAMAKLAANYWVLPKDAFANADTFKKVEQLVLNQLAKQAYYEHLSQQQQIQEYKLAYVKSANDTFGQIGQLGQLTHNRALQIVGAAGQHVTSIFSNIISLQGPIPLVGFAAINPILGIAIGALSLFGLRRQNRQVDPLHQVHQQLRGLSDQIAALHRDTIAGFNGLALGQRQIYNTLVKRFEGLESIISKEHTMTREAIGQNLDRTNRFLTLIHHDLGNQIQQISLQPFRTLTGLITNALTHPQEGSRVILLTQLIHNNKIVEFENCLIDETNLTMLNGRRYMFFLQDRHVVNYQNLLNNILVREDGLNLGHLVSYLASLAVQYAGGNFLQAISIESLINPGFWLEAIATYTNLREELCLLDIEHHLNPNSSAQMIAKGDNYVRFIELLQQNKQLVFAGLLDTYRQHQEALANRARALLFNRVNERENLDNRDVFKHQIAYSFSTQYIDLIANPVRENMRKAFQDYGNALNTEINKIKEIYQAKLTALLLGWINNEPLDKLAGSFQYPLVHFARHRGGSSPGQSTLEVWHDPLHWSPFYANGFNMSFSLCSLFAADQRLREAIPPSLYMAELLGLGYFNIDFIASNAHFTDAEHKALTGMYNFSYHFQVRFITPGQAIDLCHFTCGAEQVPVEQFGNDICLLLKDSLARMNAVHHWEHPPAEYWNIANCRSKIHPMCTIRHFTQAKEFTKHTVTDEMINTMNAQITAKLNEIKTLYHQPIAAQLNLFTEELDAINGTRNVILAMLHLCGAPEEKIEAIKGLWSQSDIARNAQQQLLAVAANAPLLQLPGVAEEQQAQNALEQVANGNTDTFGLGYRVAEIKLALANLESVLIAGAGTEHEEALPFADIAMPMPR